MRYYSHPLFFRSCIQLVKLNVNIFMSIDTIEKNIPNWCNQFLRIFFKIPPVWKMYVRLRNVVQNSLQGLRFLYITYILIVFYLLHLWGWLRLRYIICTCIASRIQWVQYICTLSYKVTIMYGLGLDFWFKKKSVKRKEGEALNERLKKRRKQNLPN